MTEVPIALRSSSGFTYLLVLFWVAVMGIALGVVGQAWHTMAMRDKEQDLLFIGDQFRRAIAAYSSANPKVADSYPKTLDDLLLDPNQPNMRRYLRRIYADPFSGEPTWGLIRTSAGGIIGVYSLAKGKPIKIAGFPSQYAQFAQANNYADWKFAVAPLELAAQNPSVAAAAPTQAPVATASSPSATIEASAQGDGDEEPSCQTRAAWDQESCQNEVRKWGTAERCFDSAYARLQACLSGRRLPELVLRYQ
jgi:type II secretory pathway pseudopilin PulG